MLRILDITFGRWTRHLFFIVVRSYYALFYNVSASGKHLLQDQPGALILATHVSRHDGPLIASLLYTTTRVRPVVHYKEYYAWYQRPIMFVISAIPVSSPRTWSPEARALRKIWSLGIMGKVVRKGSAVLLFPAGRVRRQPDEIIAPHFSGAYDVMRAHPDVPVLVLTIEGLGRYQRKLYDGFWSWLGFRNGRRHVSVDIRPLPAYVNASLELATFNEHLQDLLNTPVTPEWDTQPGKPTDLERLAANTPSKAS